jgi:predicted DNA-binding transcriptional regulator YafY
MIESYAVLTPPVVLTFDYVNHRGEASRRRARPVRVWFGRSDFDEGEHWFVRCFDLDRQADRDFVLCKMANITEVADEAV